MPVFADFATLVGLSAVWSRFDGRLGQIWHSLRRRGVYAVLIAAIIERMFRRLKDFRRTATRYDKLGRNFFSAVLIAATVIWWLN